MRYKLEMSMEKCVGYTVMVGRRKIEWIIGGFSDDLEKLTSKPLKNCRKPYLVLHRKQHRFEEVRMMKVLYINKSQFRATMMTPQFIHVRFDRRKSFILCLPSSFIESAVISLVA